MVFCPYLRKYQHFSVKDVVWDHFEKIGVCPYIRKYQYSRKRSLLSDNFEKTTFFKIILKTVLCPYLCKYQHFTVKHVVWDHFEKMENDVFCDHFEKTVFCPCPRNINIRGIGRYFQIILKKSMKTTFSDIFLKKWFFAHIFVNINISG